jgi:hypothetical protein
MTMPKPTPKDEGYGFDSIGASAGQAWTWQEWGLCAAWVLVGVAASLVTPERVSIGLAAVVAAATFLFVVLRLRGRRDTERTRRSGRRS